MDTYEIAWQPIEQVIAGRGGTEGDVPLAVLEMVQTQGPWVGTYDGSDWGFYILRRGILFVDGMADEERAFRAWRFPDEKQALYCFEALKEELDRQAWAVKESAPVG